MLIENKSTSEYIIGSDLLTRFKILLSKTTNKFNFKSQLKTKDKREIFRAKTFLPGIQSNDYICIYIYIYIYIYNRKEM